jgi:WD40 repeat protein
MMIINIGNNKMPIMTEKNKGQIILLMTVVLLTGDTHSWCFHKSFATPDPINQVNYSPDNALIVVAGGNNAYIYNAYSFEQIAVYATIPPKAVNTAKFSKDQKYIAVAGDQNTVNILNATTYKIMVNLPSGFNPVF